MIDDSMIDDSIIDDSALLSWQLYDACSIDSIIGIASSRYSSYDSSYLILIT